MPTSPESDHEVPEDLPEETASSAEEPPGEAADPAADLQAEVDRLQDRYQRAVADLENYRKRTEREGARRVVEARHALIRDWLEVLDSIERALDLNADDPGLRAIESQIHGILTRHGIHRIEATGTPFDPTRHEAVSVQPAEDLPDRTVTAIARAGFEAADGDVVRPAQVVVSRASADGA